MPHLKQIALWQHRLPAPRATPLRILMLDKSGKRILLYKGEIFDPARPVVLMIPCVDSLQVPARESAAFTQNGTP
jgi:hypothetical protein